MIKAINTAEHILALLALIIVAFVIYVTVVDYKNYREEMKLIEKFYNQID